MRFQFKDFLISENKYYLGQKSGDLLSAMQALSDDSPNIGNREMIRATQGLINQIRRILHSRWDDEDLKYLKTLQKIGVALCKAIDEKEDIATIVSSAQKELEEMINDMEVPVNNLGSEDEAGQEQNEPISQGSELEA
jgi:hypothetical protein